MTFKPSYSGIGDMLRSEFMVAAMAERAEKIKTVAEAIAPEDTGHYKESFRIETSRAGGIHHDRAEARVINDADYAIDLEFGTGDTPKFRTLGKASDAARG